MTIKEFKELLSEYPEDATLEIGVAGDWDEWPGSCDLDLDHNIETMHDLRTNTVSIWSQF